MSPFDIDTCRMEIAQLRAEVEQLELLRQAHGIGRRSDPIALDQTEACRAIYQYWQAEQCGAAYEVLRRYATTHDNINRAWALQMVKAAQAELEQCRARCMDLQAATENLPSGADVAALQFRAESAEAQLAAAQESEVSTWFVEKLRKRAEAAEALAERNAKAADDYRLLACTMSDRVRTLREALEKFRGQFDYHGCTGTAEDALDAAAPKEESK
jgi:hypothetical protein